MLSISSFYNIFKQKVEEVLPIKNLWDSLGKAATF